MSQFFQITEPENQTQDSPQEDVSSSTQKALGIDLGTTHSVVAVVEEKRKPPYVFSMADGSTLIPSVVSYEEDSIRVGALALEDLEAGSAQIVRSAKRYMNQAGIKTFDVKGNTKTPVEVMAHILAHLKEVASHKMNTPFTKAVITIPAYYDDTARSATKMAAKLAGLEVLRLIHEPTAAALAYGLDKGVEGLYAVYDLGGGTFDFSLLKLEKGIFKVVATGGDLALGGDDFDEDLLSFLKGKDESLASFLKKNPSYLTKMLLKVRNLKEKLSQELFWEENLQIGEKEISLFVTQQDYNALIVKRVSKTLEIVAHVLKEAKISLSDVQGVLLVGGATRTPLVQERVKEFFKQNPLTDLNPDEVVAIGAAYQAHALTHGSETLLLDITPLSLGIETMGGIVEKIIPRNSPIPLYRSQEFTTYQEGQTAILIHILQGEHERVEDCRSLAKFELRGIPPMPRGMARILVSFAVDADGLLTVSAEEKSTGARQEVMVYPTYGLDADKIKAILFESL